MKKYSRQRQAVRNILTNTTSHPTAEEIYFQAKKEYPSISLATVYRNLKEMQTQREIIVIDCGDEKEHFDADISSHAHFYCRNCKQVSDIYLTEEQMDYISLIKPNCDYQLVFSGLCDKCNK